MIDSVLLPHRIGNYTLFSTQYIGISIHPSIVYVAHGHTSARTSTITGIVSEPIHNGEVRQALQAALTKLHSSGNLRIALMTNQGLYHELKIPFETRAAVEAVLPFEVSQKIPLPIEQVQIDFIQTDQSAQLVFAAAVPVETVRKTVEIVTGLERSVNYITIDSIAVYGLLKKIPDFFPTEKTVLAAELLSSGINLLCVINGTLKAVRSIQYPANKPADPTQIIKDTIDAINAQGIFAINAPQIYLYGTEATDIIVEALKKNLTPDVALFDPALLTTAHVTIAEKAAPLARAALSAIAAAVDSPITEEFNLNRPYVIERARKNILYQLLFTGIFALVGLAAVIIPPWRTIRNFKREIAQGREEALNALKTKFRAEKISSDEEPSSEQLTAAIDTTDRAVTQGLKKWFAFSRANSVLLYLQELSTLFADPALGLTLTHVSIAGDGVTFDGVVRDFDALALLEKRLQKSQFFMLKTRLTQLTLNGVRLERIVKGLQ